MSGYFFAKLGASCRPFMEFVELIIVHQPDKDGLEPLVRSSSCSLVFLTCHVSAVPSWNVLVSNTYTSTKTLALCIS